jgi:hypothetical protein
VEVVGPGTTDIGGGGGAGGFRQNYPSPTIAGLPVTATTYPITVGVVELLVQSPGVDLVILSIFSTITSAGGGGGGSGCLVQIEMVQVDQVEVVQLIMQEVQVEQVIHRQ